MVPQTHTVVHPGTVVIKPVHIYNSEREREREVFICLATQCWQAAQCLERSGRLTRQVEQKELLLNWPLSHSSAIVYREKGLTVAGEREREREREGHSLF